MWATISARTVARVEVTSTGHDERGRRLFEFLLHSGDGSRSSAWGGLSYESAISAAEAWAADGVDVVDTVIEAVDAEIEVPPRVPEAWVVVEHFSVVQGIHVEIWRRTATDRAIVAVSPVPVSGGFVAAILGSMATLDLLKFSAGSILVTLQTAGVIWAPGG